MKRGWAWSWLRVMAALLLMRVVLLTSSPAAQLLCFFGFLVFLAPWVLVRHVAVPLGWRPLAALLGWMAEDRWDGDATGGRLVATSWVVLRHGGSPPGEVRHVGVAGLVAAGFLAAAAGDRERARRLLASVDLMPHGTTPREGARLAATWRMADALARGAWAEALDLGPRLGLRGRFLALAARRLGGLGVVGDAELRRAWWFAGARRADRPLLDRAHAAQVAAETLVVTIHPEESPLGAALRRHATLVPQSLTAASLMATAAAWDGALAATESTETRAAALGVSDVSVVLGAMAAAAENDLAETALAARVAVPDGPGMIGRVHRRVRERVIGDVEAACRDLEKRLGDKRDLAPLLEWTEVLGVLDLAGRAAALGGPQVRRLVFVDVHGAVCPLACHLWNDRREHALAGALFRWLFDEATAVGDERLAEHERRNLQPGR